MQPVVQLFFPLVQTAVRDSFCAYLERLRLFEGERLLLTTDRDISGIALEVGFSTPSYFIECFRRHYGVAPGAFRAQVRRTT